MQGFALEPWILLPFRVFRAGCGMSASKEPFECFDDRFHATFAGFVFKIVLPEVALPGRRGQVAPVQQASADAAAVLGLESRHELPHFAVGDVDAGSVLPFAASVFETQRDNTAGESAAHFLPARHAGPEARRQPQGGVLVEMQFPAKGVQHGLGAVVSVQKLFYGNIAFGFHKSSPAQRRAGFIGAYGVTHFLSAVQLRNGQAKSVSE